MKQKYGENPGNNNNLYNTFDGDGLMKEPRSQLAGLDNPAVFTHLSIHLNSP